MDPESSPFHRLTLAASSDQIPLDHCAALEWSVLGIGASVSSVHLMVSFNGLPYLIASLPEKGATEVIFTRAGWFTFRLTATFGDGLKASREINIQVK